MRRVTSRGMIQVRGVTYRVERLAPHHYAVVRILDDAALGTFVTLPGLRVSPTACETELLVEIARTALRFARTSGAMAAVRPPPEPKSRPTLEPANDLATSTG
jgi:hypothetical protein